MSSEQNHQRSLPTGQAGVARNDDWNYKKLVTKMSQPKRYLITSALPYANGYKHIGHLAGAYIPADIYVRYLRAQKRDVVFVCGSDEHGTAIPIQAMKENTTPRAIIDKYHVEMKEDFADLKNKIRVDSDLLEEEFRRLTEYNKK